jgi:hypothetical protein
MSFTRDGTTPDVDTTIFLFEMAIPMVTWRWCHAINRVNRFSHEERANEEAGM